MPVLLEELTRLKTDRAARFGFSVAAAVVALLIVLSQSLGPAMDLIAVVLAPTLLVWRRRPVLALLLGYAACAAVPVIQHVFHDGAIYGIGPLLLVVVPILGGALDDRAWVRSAAFGLAGALPLAVGLWGVQVGIYSGSRSGIVASAVAVAAVPVLIAAVWRRPPMRAALIAFVRDRAPMVDRHSPRFQVAAGVATAAYLLAALLGLGERDLRPLVVALPLAASLIWFRSRTDAALVLAGTGLLIATILVPIADHSGSGLTLAMLYAVVPVFGAATSGSAALRRFGAALVVATGFVIIVLTGSVLAGFLVLAIGGLPYLFDLVQQQTRTSKRLQTRLKESEHRGKVAERDVRVEQDRNRIARDVHDVVAHSLAVVIAQADGARFAAEASPASVGPALDAIAETARTALGEVRTMLHDLKHDGGDTVVPGTADVPALVEGVRALGVDVEEVVFGEPATLDEAAGLAMYRIVQEALTNALRHGAKEAPVRLEADWGDAVVVLAITNRTDPDAAAATERQGHGIEGMRERAELAGGECTAGPGSDGSFRVRVTLPVQPRTVTSEADDVHQESSTTPFSLAALLRLGAPARA